MRRLLVVSILVMGVITVFIPNAAATTQTVTKIDVTIVLTDSEDCSFPFSATEHITGTRIRFFDATGALVKAVYQLSEQDTFSSNGKSLTGDEYSYNLAFSVENGLITDAVINGVGERILLPDGALFFSAGVFLSVEDLLFPFTPAHGLSPDINALCAALSP